MPRAAAAQRTTTDDPVDTLLSLVVSLRGLQLSGNDHPWLSLSVSMAQLKTLLLLLQTGGLTARGLADRLGIGPSAVTPLVDRLVDHKLVRREPDPKDRRITWIRPTAKAEALQARLTEANRTVMAEVLAELPARDHARVQESLRLLLGSVERVMAKRRR